MRFLGLLLAVLLLVAGCGGANDETSESSDPGAGGNAQQYPDVQEAELSSEGDGTFSADVTISSPYDTPERYADGWRVLGPDGEVLGEHELTHDHADEQPFTRTQSGLQIPDGVDTVTIEGRDSANGYGGETVDVEVP